jgi:hypothetical protein
LRANEHFAALFIPKESKQKKKRHWNTPKDMIKLNVNAAISTDQSSIAVIARDSQGMVVKALRKELMLYEPVQAKAFAIL